jgi:hypothetical protein
MDMFYLLSVFPVSLAIVMLVVYIDEVHTFNLLHTESKPVLPKVTYYPQPNRQEYNWDVQSFFS